MTDAPSKVLRALVEDLAANGLRFDMTPTHEMSSLNTAERFWHDYFRRADASVRERAAAALTPSAEPPQVGAVGDALGRFGHHPYPANDFCIEVECLQARLYNARIGFNKAGLEPETVEVVHRD